MQFSPDQQAAFDMILEREAGEPASGIEGP